MDFLHRIEDLRILPRTAKAIKLLNDNNFLVVVISNQSGIARGYYGIKEMEEVNREIQRRIKRQGARIDRFYYCPHYPKGKVPEFSINCQCRKPAPGLFLKAAKELKIDFAGSFAIGDRIRDIQPAMNLGCKGILVKTGYWKIEKENLDKWKVQIDFIAKDLYAAAEWILEIIAKSL